jgi:hypothetical protein
MALRYGERVGKRDGQSVLPQDALRFHVTKRALVISQTAHDGSSLSLRPERPSDAAGLWSILRVLALDGISRVPNLGAL